MHQRQPHFGSVLTSVLAFAVTLVGVAPPASHAQGLCATELHDQTTGSFRDGGSDCQTAVNGKCSFQLALCVNQGDSCTHQDLKTKKIKATGHCGPVAKINVKPNGMSAVCGTPSGLTVRTKKQHKNKPAKPGMCKLRVKAGKGSSNVSRFTLVCQPQAGLCPNTTTTTATTMTTTSTTTTTLCAQACACGASAPTKLSFTTGIGSGNCGTIMTASGVVNKNLACGGLYTGGGSNSVPLPYAVPDMGNSLIKASCCGTTLTLANLTSAATGDNRNCTSVGCLFGPPLPIPNPASTPTSVCVVNKVTTDATGSAECSTGVSSLNLPLNSELFLDGDLFPNAPGIQVCPVCNHTCNAGSNNSGPCNVDADCPGGGAGSCTGPNTCHGGPNNGNGCTPADSVVGTLSVFPTSHDCPPPAALDIGGLPIAFALTTGAMTRTAQTISGQNNVFCGYCRDISAAATGCFEGDPNNFPTTGCPRNNLCTAAGSPFLCCTGNGTGSCDQAPKPCTAAAQCTDGNGTWPDCQQKNPGAFSGGGAHTITEIGSPAGNLTDGLGHASTLVSIFCIQPTFNATVDNTGDLPGPGAVSLPGTAQLQ